MALTRAHARGMLRLPLLATAAWIMLAQPLAAEAATILVRAGADLQQALNGARGGDTILLEAGTVFVGNFVLPVRTDREPITIRTSATGARLPGDASRVTPEVSYLLPKLRSPNAEPALRTAPGARGWRIVLLEFLGSADGGGEIIRLGDGGQAQSNLARVPRDIVIDRCYIHAEPEATQKRGVALNSADTTVRNSWISEIKAIGQDSQAIAGWNGPGPFSILNNRLEAAGEGFLLGGADPVIRGLVPTDVTFAGNHVTRPLRWRGSNWQVKNLFELKNARNVRVYGNLFENNWRAGQSGHAILFTPRNQDGAAPWATVEDVLFRYNVVRHVAAGMNVLGQDSPNPSGRCRRLDVAHNLFYDVDGSAWGGNGDFLLIGDGPADIAVTHNTILQTGKIVSVYGGTAARPTPVQGFVFRSNIVRHNEYGVHGSDRGVGSDTLATYFPAAVFTGNVLAGAAQRLYPAGNQFPPADDFDRLFVDPGGADFRLAQGAQPPRDAAGSPAGADIVEVNEAWRAAQQGWQARLRKVPPPERERAQRRR